MPRIKVECEICGKSFTINECMFTEGDTHAADGGKFVIVETGITSVFDRPLPGL